MKLIDAGIRSGSVQPASPETQSRTFTWAALKRPVRPGKSVGVAGSGVRWSVPQARGRPGEQGDGQRDGEAAGGAGAGAPDG